MPEPFATAKSNETVVDEDSKRELKTVDGVIRRRKVLIKGEEAKRLYEEGYYGLICPDNDETIVLDAFEAALLLERGRLVIRKQRPNDDKTYTAQEFIEKYALNNTLFWEKYLVYKDLRSRGYPVKTGIGRTIDFFVYPRGAKAGTKPAKFFVHIVNESTPTTLTKLLQASQYAEQNKRKLVLAISDRTGDVTYYEVSSLKLQRKNYGP
ncbi:MAG: tRNA-intron lyase [Candidatus Ranarchaeia archaeon]